jgi:hypothetical protein
MLARSSLGSALESSMVGDLTIRRTQRHGPMGSSRPPVIDCTEYIRADRKREEHRGWFGYRVWPHGRTIYRPSPRIASIVRCDLTQMFLLNLDDREYATWPLQTHPSREEWLARAAPGDHVVNRREPTVLVETETVDTGERKECFGHTARHVITTRRVIPLDRAKQGPSETATDGWYIDLDTHLLCDSWWQSARTGHAFATMTIKGEEGDFPTFKDIGEPERGYVVSSTTTSSARITQRDGSTEDRISIGETEVTHLSAADLEPVLFEVPADFKLVEQIRQEPAPPLSIRLKRTYDRFARRRRHA